MRKFCTQIERAEWRALTAQSSLTRAQVDRLCDAVSRLLYSLAAAEEEIVALQAANQQTEALDALAQAEERLAEILPPKENL